jgi:hypothetical protein
MNAKYDYRLPTFIAVIVGNILCVLGASGKVIISLRGISGKLLNDHLKPYIFYSLL